MIPMAPVIILKKDVHVLGTPLLVDELNDSDSSTPGGDANYFLSFTLDDLWDVRSKPPGWDKAKMPVRACMAANVMAAEHRNRHESSQILFLGWIVTGGVLPADRCSLVRVELFKKMNSKLQDIGVQTARDWIEKKYWRPLLSIATAFAYKRRILHWFNDEYYRSHSMKADPQRESLGLDQLANAYALSKHSICYSGPRPRWIVYSGAGRYPYMSPKIAAWFTHVQVHWEESDPVSFCRAMAACLNCCTGAESLQRFLAHWPDEASNEVKAGADRHTLAEAAMRSGAKTGRNADRYNTDSIVGGDERNTSAVGSGTCDGRRGNDILSPSELIVRAAEEKSKRRVWRSCA